MRGAMMLLLALVGSASVLAAPPAAPRVSFELIVRPGLPLNASQQWYKVLSEAGVAGLQIKSGTGKEEVGITQQGGKAGGEYRVLGIIGADNALYLPGGKFSLNDSGRIKKWMADLGDLGSEGVTDKRAVFGLIARQLQQVQDDLKKPVAFSTMEMPAAQAVAQIGKGLAVPLELSTAAERALGGMKVEDELQGLASGTALAAILRPAGMALTPGPAPGGEVRYTLGKPAGERDSWPVGWPTRDKPAKVLPELFDFLNVEIKDIPVSEAVAAVQGRLKVPLLYDHVALALHEIDPTKVDAEVPSKRSTYSLILSKVLLQAKLKYELRLDDADKPFLWISSVKAVR